MFDIDQDVEILAVIQAAYQIVYNTTLSSSYLNSNLRKAINELEQKYGKEIFTYEGV